MQSINNIKSQYVQGGTQNDPVFDLSLTILETNIQKERSLHGDLSSVNQVFNVTTITSGNFLNMNCDVVDYLMAHILSYLLQA
jgi:hypothetical protein